VAVGVGVKAPDGTALEVGESTWMVHSVLKWHLGIRHQALMSMLVRNTANLRKNRVRIEDDTN
jgi:hypothetical protein